MSRITKLALRDWKGLSVDAELARLNLLSGPTGSGKSAHLQAIRFAISGATELGSTNDDTQMLCGPLGGSVGIALDDGFGFVRHLARDARENKVSQSVDVNGRTGTLKAQDAIIADHCGDCGPGLDLREFTAISPEKRRKYALDVCSAAAGPRKLDDLDVGSRITIGVLEAKLGPATVRSYAEAKLGKVTEKLTSADRLTVITALMPKVDESVRNAIGKAMGEIRAELKGDLATGIAAAIAKADACKQLAKQARDRAHATVQEVSARKAGLKVPAASADELRAQRETLLKQKEEAVQQISLQEGKASGRATLTKAIQDIDSKITGLEVAIRNLQAKPPAEMDVAAMTAKAEELEKAATLPDDPRAVKEREAEEAKSTHMRSLQDLYGVRQQLNNATAALSQLETTIARLEAAPTTKLLEKWNVLASAFEGSKDPVFAEVDALIKQVCQSSALDSMRSELPKRQDTRDALSKQVQDHEGQISDLTKVVDSTHAAAREARLAWAAATSDRDDNLRQARGIRFQIEEHNRIVSEYANRIQKTTGDMAAAKNARIETERKLVDLDAQGGQIPLEELTGQRDRIAGQIVAVDADLDAKIRYHALDKELNEVSAQAERQQVEYEVYDLVGDSARGIREDLMKDLVAPLLDRINRFLEVAKPGWRAYCELVNDRGKPIFELGWTDGMVKRALPALSGGETAVYGAALAYALVCLKNPPLRLLLMELAEADTAAVMAICDAIGAVQQDISNAVVATWNPLVGVTAEWNVIHATRTAVAA